MKGKWVNRKYLHWNHKEKQGMASKRESCKKQDTVKKQKQKQIKPPPTWQVLVSEGEGRNNGSEAICEDRLAVNFAQLTNDIKQ